ncbi:MAG: CHAT domain-containing protein [Crocosphaera sp.]|nr:CHAT domain-containing protein [Crocosphaera sp.]
MLTFCRPYLLWQGIVHAVTPSVAEQQGRELYQQGEIDQAIATWLSIAQQYEQQGDIVGQGRVLSYLALAYSQLGQWDKANTSIAQSLDLLQSQEKSREILSILAEALNIEGTLLLAQGNSLSALSSWEKSTEIYQQIDNKTGILRTEINQARALQNLGIYNQACQRLVENLVDEQVNCQSLTFEEVNTLLSNDLSPLKQAGWLSLAQILRQKGNFVVGEEILKQILSQVSSSEKKASIFLDLGRNLERQSFLEEAKSNYQKAIITANNFDTLIQAQLSQLNLLILQKSWPEVEQLSTQIEQNLSQLKLNTTKVDGQIYLGSLLLKWSQLSDNSNLLPSWIKIEQIFKQAQANSQILNYEKGLIYGVGNQGKLYESLAISKLCKTKNNSSVNCSKTNQFSDINQVQLSLRDLQNKAKQLTEQALSKSQALQIPSTTYSLQWQLGRILNSLGNEQEAITAYLEAVRYLKILAVDLSRNRESQFSFQEKVEPVYRELLSLLLPQNNREDVSQKNLKEARKQIEALQVAELNNFFQDICVESQPIDISTVDPNAAIIYPLILSDRLAILIDLPNQPLQVRITQVSQKELEKIAKQFRYNIVIRSQREFFKDGKKLYDWLIEPFIEQLQQAGIKTLVFVPDGILRNIPLDALYDGQKYLIENYKVALTSSLTLLSPQSLQEQGLKTLFSGLTETYQKDGLIPLFYVKQELKAITSQVPNMVLINEEFTLENLQSTLKNKSFPIVHFATHGQFSSQFEETFLVAWNSSINVLELEKLLKENDPRGINPIELLILSACETAAGDNRAALGLAGFAVRAGARSTLATLWSVNDQASAVIMEEFYKQLSTNKLSKAEALRQAQLTMLADRWYKHPFYWSAYTLVGNWL